MEPEIRQLLKTINDAWLTLPPEAMAAALGPCFHPDMVTKGPGFATFARGRDANVFSYVGFMRRATVRGAEIHEADVEVTGDTAVASFAWRLRYAMSGSEDSSEDGSEFDDTGRDLFVFTRVSTGGAAAWQAVWRAVMIDPK